MTVYDWQNTPCIPGGNARRWWVKKNGSIPDGLWVCHYCDNEHCKNTEHMWLGTPSEDIKDAVVKGRWKGWIYDKRGPGNGMAKLTEEQAKIIKYSTKNKHELAIEFGVGYGTIDSIIKGRTWRYL